MVDSQFADDKYVDSEERNREALAEANRRAAEREALTPKVKSRAEIMSERALAIQQAAKKVEHGDRIVLREFSRYTPNEEEISVMVKRLSPQELLAGDLLPVNARKLVNYFVEIGQRATSAENMRVGIQNISSEDVVNDVFDGDSVSATDAYTGMVNAIAISCVKDPDIRLYWNERAKAGDPNGVLINVIPFADREAIANWALQTEEKAAETVAPFLQQPTADAKPVSAVEKRDGKTERADQV